MSLAVLQGAQPNQSLAVQDGIVTTVSSSELSEWHFFRIKNICEVAANVLDGLQVADLHGREMRHLAERLDEATSECWSLEIIIYNLVLKYFYDLDLVKMRDTVADFGKQSPHWGEAGHFFNEEAVKELSEPLFPKRGPKNVDSPSNYKLKAVWNKWAEVKNVTNEEEALQGYDQVMKMAYDASLTLLLELIKDADEWGLSCVEALTYQATYHYKAFFTLPTIYRVARSGFMDYGTHQPTDLAAFTEKFHQINSRERTWREMYNLYRQHVAHVVDLGDLQNADQRFTRWITEDTGSTFVQPAPGGTLEQKLHFIYFPDTQPT